MSITSRMRERRVSAAVGAALAMFLGLYLLIFDVGRGLTDLSFDLPFVFHPTERPQDVVIIYMDEQSHRDLPRPYQEPWDRRLHAAMVKRLEACGTKAVVFDILFDQTNLHDHVLVDALKAHGKVVVGARYAANPSGILEVTPPFAELARTVPWGVAERADRADLPTGLDAADRLKRFNRIVLRACENSLKRRYGAAWQMRNDLLQLTRPRGRLRGLFKWHHL